METFIEKIKNVEQQLAHYLNPSNHEGFVQEFLPWVENRWENEPFYKSRFIQFKDKITLVPMRTDSTIKECVNNYAEFLNSYNGETHRFDNDEFYNETQRDDFILLFHSCKFRRFHQLIEENEVVLPESLMTHQGQTVVSTMWSNEWTLKQHPELQALWRDFKSKYGSMGSFNEYYLEFSAFSEMTLNEIKSFHNDIQDIKKQ